MASPSRHQGCRSPGARARTASRAALGPWALLVLPAVLLFTISWSDKFEKSSSGISQAREDALGRFTQQNLHHSARRTFSDGQQQQQQPLGHFVLEWGTSGPTAAAALAAYTSRGGRAGGAAGAAQTESGSQEQQQPARWRCAVINNVGWHFDVAAGLAWAFQEAGCNVTTFLMNNELRIQDVMADWYHGSYDTLDNILKHAGQFDSFIFATFPEAHAALLRELLYAPLGRSQQRRRQQRYLLVVHNPDKLLYSSMLQDVLLARAMQPAVQAAVAAAAVADQQQGGQQQGGQPQSQQVRSGLEPPSMARRLQQQAQRPQRPTQLQLATLAPFVSQYTKNLLERWSAIGDGSEGVNSSSATTSTSSTSRDSSKGSVAGARVIEVPWLSPLVPWPDAAATSSDSVSGSSAVTSSKPRHLCIQGIIDPWRRDYAGAFAAVGHPAVLRQLRRHNESLLLLGRTYKRTPQVTAQIPRRLKPYVQILSSLPYQEYYETLSQCRAILPAFGSDAYLVNKSSSTVATAINVGTPLVAESRIVEAYSYLQPDTVFDYRPPDGASPHLNVTALAFEGAEAASRWASAQKVLRELNEAKQKQKEQQKHKASSTSSGGGGSSKGGSASGKGHTHSAAAKAKSQRGGMRRLQGLPAAAEELPLAVAGSRQLRRLAAAAEDAAAAVWGVAKAIARSGGGGGSGKGRHSHVLRPEVEEEEEDEREELEAGRPEAGSYEAALLAAFEPGASARAHAAAWQLKRVIMRRNVEAARHFLEEAAAAGSHGAEQQDESRADGSKEEEEDTISDKVATQ